MKKALTVIIVIMLIQACLFTSASAVIQSPPKNADISVSVYKTDTAPVLDGVIGEDEYQKLDISSSDLSLIVGSDTDWNRARNTKFSAYASVCDGVFYFALTVAIPQEYYNTGCEPKNMWAQSCLMTSYAKQKTNGRNALEIGVRPGGGYYIWNYYNNVRFDIRDSFKAVYSDGAAVYETAVPLSAFGAENDGSFLFCFCISAGDYFNGERQVYIQYGRGISGFSTTEDADAGKDAALFPTVRIVAPGEETDPSETTKNEGGKTPDTSFDLKSVILICASVMAVSLFAAYLMMRKQKV